jgi:hypothetical protein
MRDRNGITLIPFDLDVWAKGAGSTLIQSNRHARHPTISEDGLHAAAQEVWQMLSSVSPQDYDSHFFELALEIRKNHLPYMTFGRTQKFINMIGKYAYCLYWSDLDPAWNRQNPWVQNLSPQFHIPVDAIVLYSLRKENRNFFVKFITTPTLQQKRKYARFILGDTAVGWSELDRTYPYIAVQQYVLDHPEGAITPMHREM